MYAEVFGLDVPLTQSQPTESTQGAHRTPSAPRSPAPKKDTAESNTLQVSLAEYKSQEEQEARENVELVNKHLAFEEIENMMEGSENVIDDSLPPKNDEPNILGTRLEPRSDKESMEVEITNDEEVEITNVVKPVNVNEEEEEITDEVYELKRREKGKIVEEKSFDTLADHLQEVMAESLPTMVDTHIKEQVKKQVLEQMIAKAILQERGNIQAEISLQIQKAIDNHIPSQVDASVRSYMSGHILHVHPAQKQTLSVPEQQYQLYLSMKDNPQLQQQDIEIWLALQMKFENLQGPQTTCRPSAVRLRDQDDPHDDAHPKGENSAKRQKTSEYEAYVSGESLSGQVNEDERDDDEIPMKQVSQDIMEEVSLTIDEAKLKKMADEMLRQRCTSGDEHQYHIDQMKNFLKSDIVWESRKEILVSLHLRKTTPLVQSCQRDPKAPTLSLIHQDLLYLKKGSSGPEKIVFLLHKFPAIIFKDDDIEERTSRWLNKCVKKFNSYARYGVEHWKNPHAKIFYIKKQKEPRKPKEEVPDYAETGLLWSLSVFIRSSVIWERVHDFQLGIESYQQKVNLTTPTISFPRVEKQKMFSIIYEPVHGIIYKNSKKEKRVMRHSEIHKFCDATLIRVLEGLKSYNNDVKYGYVQRELMNDEVECLKLFEEEIEVSQPDEKMGDVRHGHFCHLHFCHRIPSDSVGTSIAWVILFGTIPTAIPATVPIVEPPVVHDDTPLIPTEIPTIPPDPYKDIVAQWRSRVVVHSSPPSSPTHDSPPTIRQILPSPPGLPYRPAILVLPGQPIPVGRPYRTQPNDVYKMLTARKSVGPLPSHRLALRYSESHSPSDYFSPNEFSSNTSSGSSSGYSSYTSSGHSIPDSSFDSPAASFSGPYRKRFRSPTALVPLASPVPGALSSIRADLLPPRKRIKGSVSKTNYEVDFEESYEPYTEPDIDSDVQSDINAYIVTVDTVAAREVDVRVEVDTRIDREDEDDEEAESSHRGTDTREDFLDLVSADGSRGFMQIGLDVVLQELYDHMVEIPVDRITSIEAGQRELKASSLISIGERAAMSERIRNLKRDNMRLKALLSLEAYRNREPIRENEDGHEDDNGNDNGNDNGYGGEKSNGNGLGGGNGNGNLNVNVGGVMETVFYISNCPPKYQVKYASCTLQNGALTWWNSHKRTIGTDAAYAMTWRALMKLMTEVYCPRNEIQKMETELWNLTVKNNDLTAYTQRFQEL
ncbi:retrovirus-related pol polyprotein from transposon TNT 1-94, partial [Tanacetum coccineum]